MALSNLLKDKLDLTKAQAEAVQDLVIEIVQDNAVRSEVYDYSSVRTSTDEFSTADVHIVLDGLIHSMEDPR